jgi:hypothetical protein
VAVTNRERAAEVFQLDAEPAREGVGAIDQTGASAPSGTSQSAETRRPRRLRRRRVARTVLLALSGQWVRGAARHRGPDRVDAIGRIRAAQAVAEHRAGILTDLNDGSALPGQGLAKAG